MSQRGLIDIEEMVLRCRTEEAKAVIEEGVACYKAGAYRAAIVATWLAVYFDLASKLKSLALAKNSTAREWLDNYERRVTAYEPENSDTAKPLQNIENSILNMARSSDIELISHVELVDLKRLKTDRNRCAHPTMQNADERFTPTAELARTHLRNAVEYVLSRPPIQGRLAAERFLSIARDEGFPVTPSDAKESLEGPLVEGLSETNLPNVLSGLIADALDRTARTQVRHQRVAALEATKSLFPALFDRCFEGQLDQQLENVDPGQWWLVVGLLRQSPWVWSAVPPRYQYRLRTLILNADLSDNHDLEMLWDSFHISQLQPEGVQKLTELDLTNLTLYQDEVPEKHILDEAVDRLVDSGSHRDSNDLVRRLIQPRLDRVDSSHILKILNAAEENSQVASATATYPLLQAILRSSPRDILGDESPWRVAEAKFDKSMEGDNNELRELLNSIFTPSEQRAAAESSGDKDPNID